MKPNPVLLCIIASVLVGVLNLLSKGLLNAGLSPMQICACREGVTAVIFGLILLFMDRSAFRIRLKDVWLFAMFGAFNVASNVCVFTAQQTVSLEVAAVLEMTSPYFILVFAYFLFGDKITRRKVLAAVLAFLGCISIIGLANGVGDVTFIGVIFGILSGITLAAFTIGGKFVGERDYSENSAMFYFFFFSALIAIPFADVPGIFNIVGTDISLMLRIPVMGFACTLLPNYIVIYCVRRMDPATVAIIITSSIIVSTLCGVIAFGEPFVPADVVGIILILVAITLLEPPEALKRWMRDKKGLKIFAED